MWAWTGFNEMIAFVFGLCWFTESKVLDAERRPSRADFFFSPNIPQTKILFSGGWLTRTGTHFLD